jgi:hypothetical protein
MKHINTSTIDLGQGERQLTPQGYFDAHYKITYPKDLFENDTFSV